MYIWDDRDLTVKSGDKNFLNKNDKNEIEDFYLFYEIEWNGWRWADWVGESFTNVLLVSDSETYRIVDFGTPSDIL